MNDRVIRAIFDSWPNGMYRRGDTAKVVEEHRESFKVVFLTGQLKGRSGEVIKENWKDTRQKEVQL